MRTTRSVPVASRTRFHTRLTALIAAAAFAHFAGAQAPAVAQPAAPAEPAAPTSSAAPAASATPDAARASALLSSLGIDDFVIINPDNVHTLGDVIKAMNAQGRGTILIDDRVPMAPLPERVGDAVRVIDFRSNGGINIIRGHHPRRMGQWPQYSNLSTGLGKNIVLTDVVTPRTPIESWEGVPMEPQKTDFERAQDYANYHNHYQNLLIETWNFTDNVNAVSFWADSAALTPGARNWGGFISARSWPFRWGEYLPDGTPDFADPDFDAALVGLEIDVLNYGLAHGEMSPKIGQKLSKIGLQLVGFGKQSTAAVEIRSLDTDAHELTGDQRSGTWYYGIIANNCFNSESTFIKASFDRARIGLDFSVPEFWQGAIKIRSSQPGSGILVNEGTSGEIFGGPRPGAEPNRNWMGIRSGDAGVRVVSRDAKRELLVIDEAGNISIPGTLTLAGKKIDPAKLAALLDGPLSDPLAAAPITLTSGPITASNSDSTRALAIGLGVIVLALSGALAWMASAQRQMRRQLAHLVATTPASPASPASTPRLAQDAA